MDSNLEIFFDIILQKTVTRVTVHEKHHAKSYCLLSDKCIIFIRDTFFCQIFLKNLHCNGLFFNENVDIWVSNSFLFGFLPSQMSQAKMDKPKPVKKCYSLAKTVDLCVNDLESLKQILTNDEGPNQAQVDKAES